MNLQLTSRRYSPHSTIHAPLSNARGAVFETTLSICLQICVAFIKDLLKGLVRLRLLECLGREPLARSVGCVHICWLDFRRKVCDNRVHVGVTHADAFCLAEWATFRHLKRMSKAICADGHIQDAPSVGGSRVTQRGGRSIRLSQSARQTSTYHGSVQHRGTWRRGGM
jgi:hypothetical protein